MFVFSFERYGFIGCIRRNCFVNISRKERRSLLSNVAKHGSIIDFKLAIHETYNSPMVKIAYHLMCHFSVKK